MTTKLVKPVSPILPYRKILPDGYICPEPEYRVDSLLQSEYIDESGHLLRYHYAGQPGTLVDTGAFVFYDPTDMTRRRFRPDLYIVFGVDRESVLQRNGYIIDEAGKPPDFVLEVASPTTYRNDLRNKPVLYARVGIGEYWRFDPSGGDYYGNDLAGDTLVDGAYQPIELTTEPDGMVWGYSPALDLCLCVKDNRLNYYDRKTGSYLNSIGEEHAAHRQTAAALDEERAARQQTAAELDEERAARQQTAAERDQAAAERDAARAEAARLREELRRLQDE